MRGQIILRIVEMDERAIDIAHALEHVLQTLAQVVAVVQRRVLVQHNVHLDVKPVARVVRLQVLDPPDAGGEPHHQVQQHAALVGRGGRARQMRDVLVCRPSPVAHHVHRQDQTTRGIEEPQVGICADWQNLSVSSCAGEWESVTNPRER